MSRTNKTLPGLQKKLNYQGSDATFKKYVLAALKNRGDIYSEAFKKYYGIGCKKRTAEQILEELPIYDIYSIKNLVMHCIEKEIKIMMEGSK